MKLNLGSGINGHAALNVITLDHTGWKNIEIQEAYEADEHYDITTGIREPDNSVEVIWMGDFFEHLLRLKSKFVMRECFRVLRPGGKLLMSVPDMQKVIPLWFNYAVNGTPPNTPQGSVQELYDCIWGGQDEYYQRNSIPDSHFNGYTEKTLKELMKFSGFIESKINRISIHNTWYELAIEAYK